MTQPTVSHVLLFAKDLLQSEFKNGCFYLRSFGFNNVRICGLVVKIVNDSTFLLGKEFINPRIRDSLCIDDDTAVIQITCSMKRNQKIEIGMSVHILGQLQEKNGEKYVQGQW